MARMLSLLLRDRLYLWSLTKRCGDFVFAVLFLVLGSSGCAPETPHPPMHLRLATGPSEGAYEILGKTLARLYSMKIPDVTVVAENTLGSFFNVDAIQQGKADLAFAQADAAYLASRRGLAGRITPLRGMAVLYVSTVQLFVRRDSPIQRVSNFRGRRIAIGAASGPTDVRDESDLGNLWNHDGGRDSD